MKHLNSRRRTRLRCWTAVPTNISPWSRFRDIKIQLQRTDGSGRFYADQTYRTFWFERSEDAVWFKLQYLG